MDIDSIYGNNDIKNSLKELHINIANECPICHSKIRIEEALIIKNDIINDDLGRLLLIFQCPNEECAELFVARYKYQWSFASREYTLTSIFPNEIEINIDNIIKTISPSYTEVYTQAKTAQQQGLHQICGVGYRKALEFLIKDYCIKNNPDKKSNIENLDLSKVIGQYVDNINIKNMAKRAVWIGNDETHYIRKWEDKDIKDLLNLIDLTCQWIILNEKTKEYTLSMQPNK